MGDAIRRVEPDDDAGLLAYVAIRNAVTPDNTDSLDQVRWEAATYPGEVTHLLAEDTAGERVGAAVTGRIWMYPRDHERFWLGIWVVPGARGRGLGSALYAAVSDTARGAGKNAALGYRPVPDWIGLQGPLAPPPDPG